VMIFPKMEMTTMSPMPKKMTKLPKSQRVIRRTKSVEENTSIRTKEKIMEGEKEPNVSLRGGLFQPSKRPRIETPKEKEKEKEKKKEKITVFREKKGRSEQTKKQEQKKSEPKKKGTSQESETNEEGIVLVSEQEVR
jgi:hypothetical protein